LRYRWIIVGAGFTGATIAERIASQLDQSVLLIDRRDHLAGNAYDYVAPNGQLVHKYGPHIFHTNSEKVWAYLSRFTKWRVYQHRVLGQIDGLLATIPFNLDSIAKVFPSYLADALSQKLVETYGFGAKVPILKLRTHPDPDVQFLAEYVYTKVFLHYTQKQWGLSPEDLDPSVTARVPVVVSRDPRYFQDRFQAMPQDGYTAMFSRMVDHPNITLALSVDYASIRTEHPAAKVVFTGPLDEYFDYEAGVLPYRSLRFEFREEPGGPVQPVATINYPNDFDFTRVTEFGHFNGQFGSSTTLVTEYSQAYAPAINDPYYPIPSPTTSGLLAPYHALSKQLTGKVWFAGRLADYAYYNMDQACARALSVFEKQLARNGDYHELSV
jgi:UDP-galactopyranose mutase